MNHWPASPPTVGFRPTTIEPWWTLAGKDILDSSGTWAAVNRIVYCPIWVTVPWRTNSIWVVNGASVASTWIMQTGIYDADAEGLPKNRLIVAIPTVQTAADATQQHPFTGDFSRTIDLAPGLYFIALIFTSTSGTVQRVAAITADGLGPACGVYTEDAASFALPLVATPSQDAIATPLPIAYLD